MGLQSQNQYVKTFACCIKIPFKKNQYVSKISIYQFPGSQSGKM